MQGINKIYVASLITISLSAAYKFGAGFHKKASTKQNFEVSPIPDFNINFAGENIPNADSTHYHKYKKEVSFYKYSSKSLRALYSRSKYRLKLVESILKKNGIPTDFKYLPVIESNFKHQVSRRGAAGFWQLTEPTALELGLVVNEDIDQRYDIILSTKAACKYFKRAHKVFGNWTDVAVSYNIGIYGLKRHLDKQGKEGFYSLTFKNRETSNYIYRVMAIKELFSNLEEHQLHNIRGEKLPYKYISIKTDILDIDKFAMECKVSPETFRQINPWIKGNRIMVNDASNKLFKVRLPISKDKLYEEVVSATVDEKRNIDEA